MDMHKHDEEPRSTGQWLSHQACENAVLRALRILDLDWRGFDIYDVDSLATEVQIQAHEYSKQEVIESPEKFVWEFAKNVVRNRARYARYRKHRKLPHNIATDESKNPAHCCTEEDENRARLAAIRTALTPGQRRVVDFILKHRLSVDDVTDRVVIAHHFDLSAEGCRILLFRIRERSREAKTGCLRQLFEVFWSRPTDKAAVALDDAAETPEEVGLVQNTLSLYREGALLAASRFLGGRDGVLMPDRMLHLYVSQVQRSRDHARRLNDPYMTAVSEWDLGSALHYQGLLRGRVDRTEVLDLYRHAAVGFVRAGRWVELACVLVAQATVGLRFSDILTPIQLLHEGLAVFKRVKYLNGVASITAALAVPRSAVPGIWHQNWSHGGIHGPPTAHVYWTSLQRGITWGFEQSRQLFAM